VKIAIVRLLILLSASRAPAQSRTSVGLDPLKHLRKGVGAWPLIGHASTPAEQNVNATLNRLNERIAKTLTDCDGSFAIGRSR
jgi:hypothetical protein